MDGVLSETDLQYKLSIEGGEYWLPKSEIELDESAGTVHVPEWLAIKVEIA